MACVVTRLEKAFAEAAKLPEHDQEMFAEFLVAELQDKREWQNQFSVNADDLALLAAEARSDYRA